MGAKFETVMEENGEVKLTSFKVFDAYSAEVNFDYK